MADLLEQMTRKLIALEKEIEQLKVQERPVIPANPVWTVWTPTFTQSVALSITNLDCKYLVEGKKVTVRGVVRFASAGTANNPIRLTNLPVAPSFAYRACDGSFIFWDSSASVCNGSIQIESATGIAFWNGAAQIGQNPNIAVAAGDELYFNFSYPIA